MNREEAVRLVSRWRRLAPRIHAHFGLDDENRKSALEAAQAHPYQALKCYIAITNSFRKVRGS